LILVSSNQKPKREVEFFIVKGIAAMSFATSELYQNAVQKSTKPFAVRNV
jgi:hypothetical protein